MAKKGQAVQLQTEVNTDEDWEKLLAKDGLIIVDVYSEWCGPCSAMAPNLKKIKLEIGGDLLQLAVAKSDTIAALERFRNKSEPTWMFLSRGKRVNFMFGANAPRLTRLITEELRKETDAREGKRERVQMEISDLADEERERYDAKETKVKAAQAIERAKRDKELRERRVAECQSILETLSNLGIILIFPHARDRYMESFGDLLGEAGVTIGSTEKLFIDENTVHELFFFEENPFDDYAMAELTSKQSYVLLIKPLASRHELEEQMEEILLRIVYGHSKRPPGDHNSPAQLLSVVPPPPPNEDGVQEEARDSIGIWTPLLKFTKATALRLFFIRLVQNYLLPEPEPIPPHFAVAFESYRRHEIAAIMNTYRNEILRYGFFTSEVPENAKLIAKTIKAFERQTSRTPEDKLIIQLARRKSECVLAFAQIKPYYMSASTVEGERECKIFFPDEYDESIGEEDEDEFVDTSTEVESTVVDSTAEDTDFEGETTVDEGMTTTEGEEGATTTDEEGEAVLEEGGGDASPIPQEPASEVPPPPQEAPPPPPPPPPPPAKVEETLPTEPPLAESTTIEAPEESSPPEAPEPVAEEAPPEESAPENILLTEAIIEELLYFTNIDLPEILITEVLKKKCLGFTLKRTSENLPNAIDDIVLQIAYGNSREPPGGEKHPYQLLKSIDEASGVEIPGIWIPPNSLAKATALKLLFPNISGPFKLADVAPIPPHILVGYDAFKYKDVLEISAQFPNQVMAYGFFTSDIPGEGQLIAKNVEKFENRTTPPTYEEKIVIKLSKTNPECLSAFSELGPSYMSANALLGGEECKMFFPADYCAPEESAVETKKKSKKKGKVKPIITNTETQDTAEISQITEEVSTDVVESNNTEQGEETALDENGDGHTSEEHDEEDDEGAEDATDKATSPIDIGRVEEDTN